MGLARLDMSKVLWQRRFGSSGRALAAALTLATFLAGCTSGGEKPAADKENLTEARRLAAAGKLEEAYVLLQKLVRDEKTAARRAMLATELGAVQCMRAEAALATGESGAKSAEAFYTEAAGWARKALEDAPGMPRAHEALGAALAGLNRPDEAMAELQEAVAGDARSVDALKAMGLIEHRRGRYTEAIGRYRQAREALRTLHAEARTGEGREDPRLVYNLAASLEARGRTEDLKEARELFRLCASGLSASEAERKEADAAVKSITDRIEKEKTGGP